MNVVPSCSRFWFSAKDIFLEVLTSIQFVTTDGTNIVEQAGDLRKKMPSFAVPFLTHTMAAADLAPDRPGCKRGKRPVGWGNTASVNFATGKLGSFSFSIHSAGTVQTASPTVTIDITAAGF